MFRIIIYVPFLRFQLESISGGFIFTILLGKYEKKTLNFAIQAFSASFAKKNALNALIFLQILYSACKFFAN